MLTKVTKWVLIKVNKVNADKSEYKYERFNIIFLAFLRLFA
jgi:hypothetical protein